MTHWAITLYERYVKLYGDPIEQPIPDDHRGKTPPTPDGADEASNDSSGAS